MAVIPGVTFCARNCPPESVLTTGPPLPICTVAPARGVPISLSMTRPRMAPCAGAEAGEMPLASTASRAGVTSRYAGITFDETPLARHLIEASMNLGASLAKLNLRSLWGRHVLPSGVDQGGWLRCCTLVGTVVPSAFPLHTRGSLCAYVSLVRCWSRVWPQHW